MNRPRLPVLLFCALVCALVSAAGCSGCGCRSDRAPARPAAEVTVITIGSFSRSIGNAPLYVARRLGWFEHEPGLSQARIEYLEPDESNGANNPFPKDVGGVFFAPDMTALILRSQGNDVRVAEVSAVMRQGVLVHTDSPLKTVGDLTGKRVATLQGSAAHYALVRILQAAKISPGDLRITNLRPQEARGAFELGEVDAWVVWPPWGEEQEIRGKGRLLPGAAEEVSNVVMLSAAFLDAHEPMARALLAVIRRAKEWIGAHPEEAQAIVVAEARFGAAAVKAAWPRYDHARRLSAATLDALQERATFLADWRTMPSGKPVDVRRELSDPRLLPR